MEMLQTNEQFVEKKLEAEATKIEKEHGDIIEEAAIAYNKKYNGHKEWTTYDTVMLGRYATNWAEHISLCEDDTSSRDVLGD